MPAKSSPNRVPSRTMSALESLISGACTRNDAPSAPPNVGVVAQSVEHRTFNPLVEGSIPSHSTNFGFRDYAATTQPDSGPRPLFTIALLHRSTRWGCAFRDPAFAARYFFLSALAVERGGGRGSNNAAQFVGGVAWQLRNVNDLLIAIVNI